MSSDQQIPSWLVFPAEGEVWTRDDIERWISTFATHLGITPKELTANAIVEAKGMLEDRRNRRAKRERLGREALFPDAPSLELIMRYEAALDRSIDRTLKQLEVLQRLRRGQEVPPPARIDLNLG